MRRWLCGLLLGLLAVSLLGCPGGWRRPQKSPGSSLWIRAGSEPLEASSLAQLRELGVAELFVEAARVEASAPVRIVPVELPKVPPSTSATLAITGEWPAVSAPEQLAEEVAEALRQLRFDAESQGIIPTGFHFDLVRVSAFDSYAAFLGELRQKLDRTLFLSISVERAWLSEAGLHAIAEPVDFLVAFLYGQRVYEVEDADAWDFVALQHNLEKLEELGQAYAIGVVGLGSATHLSKDGTVKARTTRMSLQEIVWNRRLKLQPGFSLAGVNRRVYEVAAERATPVGEWSLQVGDKIRVVRAATSDLEEMQRLLGAWDLRLHLGELFYRLPRPEEKLSVALDNLLNALDPEPASPDLELDISVQRRTGRGWIVRFSITNHNGEITELSLLDNNYLQITVPEGTFSDRVAVGDFYRYDLGIPQEDGSWKRTFRRARSIRLHVPILEGQQQVNSGDVELYVRGEPVLDLEASFLLPDGRTLVVGPYAFHDGKVDDGRGDFDLASESP